MNKVNNQSISVNTQIQLSDIQILEDDLKNNHNKIDEENVKQFNTNNNNDQIEKTQTHSGYRVDIDGLRTVAVGIVVIFHAWSQFMVGGFIGVDIFFVISGFLISKIIIKQTVRQKFTYSGFYTRRIKRIYPALILVLLTVLIFAYNFLLEKQLQIVCSTMAASTVFGANIQILTYKKGYFDPDIKTNGLLHLWSLGVQEQFYIVWPLFISLIINKFPKKSLFLLTLFTVTSFLSNVVAVFANPKFAFYFPVCRFWEMAIGGIIAYQNFQLKSANVKNGLSLLGLTAIFISIWVVNEESLFPGFWALVPSLSAALIIIAGTESFVNKKILSSRFFVFVGKISYPLYLWHWPLLVYSRMLYPEGSSSIFAKPEFMIVIAVILSILTYYLVQNPLRFHKSNKVVFILFIAMISIGIFNITSIKQNTQDTKVVYQEIKSNSTNSTQIKIVFNCSTMKQIKKIYQLACKQFDDHQTHTIDMPRQDDFYVKNRTKLFNSSKNKKRKKPTKDRINFALKFKHEAIQETRVQPSSPFFDNDVFQSADFFQIYNEGKKNKLFIVGDSHSEVISQRFLQLYQDKKNASSLDDFPTIITMSKCGIPYIPCKQNIDLFYHSTLNLIKKHKPDRVLFIYRWPLWLSFKDNIKYNQDFDDCYNRYNAGRRIKQTRKHMLQLVNTFAQTMKELKKLDIDVYVNTPSVQHKSFYPRLMMDLNGVIQSNIQPVKQSQFKENYKNIISIVNDNMKKIGVKLINLADNYCWENKCELLTPDGTPIMRDANHFTWDYARHWANTVDFLAEF